MTTGTHGHRQAATRVKSAARQDRQTNYRAFVRRRSGTILVQFSELTGPGHRGTDAATRTPVARSPGSEPRRSAAVRSADPCTRKGNKTRFLPLAPEANQLLDHYLRLERPQTSTNALFVSLKGPARGARMTPAGLRSLFRYHRRTTGVKMANPHRFRHTFASDMVRAGISLPALMRLMGHAQIQTTMVYVQVTPLEVYQQYARAVAQHIRPVPGPRS
ncbi:MAG TPA: tyrosine-type recombinase/integrase [Bryobacteraceae bacterium]